MSRRVGAVFFMMTLVCSMFVASSGPAIAGPATCFGSPPSSPAMVGTNGNDTITGTAGNDVIVGLNGKDTIDGLGGNDIICGDSDFDDPADKGDIIHGGPGFETIFGSAGADKLYGDGDRDSLFGGPGNDLINGGANTAPDVADDANFWFSPNPVVGNLATGIATGEGTDTLVQIEGLAGTSFNDKLTGNKKSNHLDGGLGPSGDDVLNGAGGSDTVTYTFSNSGVFINLQGGTAFGDGEDTLKSLERVIGSDFGDYITGTDGPDALIGSGGGDEIYARGGDDVMVGFSGNDQMYGGVGSADFVSYSDAPGPVNINLLNGNATRGSEEDLLEGIELIEGSAQNDTITGDHGPNSFYADQGDDVIDGKGGADLIFFLSAPGQMVVDLMAGTATGMATTVDQLAGIEHVVGGAYADNITGDDKRNFLNGSDGVDYVKGAGGDDYLAGGVGGDILEGGDGTQDLVDFFQSKNAVTANIQAGTATGEGSDQLIQVEALSGTAKNDNFRGSGAGNSLYGQKGKDKLFGLGGKDRLDGGPQTDKLNGGPSTDTCFTKPEATGCESFKKPGEHPLTEVGRRYKRALASARRYK